MQGIGDYAIRSLQLAALLLCLTLSAQKAPVRAGTTQPHQVALRHPGTPSDLVERTGFRLLRPPLTPACRPPRSERTSCSSSASIPTISRNPPRPAGTSMTSWLLLRLRSESLPQAIQQRRLLVNCFLRPGFLEAEGPGKVGVQIFMLIWAWSRRVTASKLLSQAGFPRG